MSIVNQIEVSEARIAEFRKQLERIESRLNTSNLKGPQRQQMKNNVKNMRQELIMLEKNLAFLRQENRKSLFLALVLLTVISIIGYILWLS